MGFLSQTESVFIESRILEVRKIFVLKILCRLQRGLGHVERVMGERTRSAAQGLLVVPLVHSALGFRSSHYLAPRLFNGLECTIRGVEGARKFRNCVREWLLGVSREDVSDLIFERTV
jgi:hypothetical protein